MSIILVHGAFADRHAFDAVAPLLEARGFRVAAPDLPGHGDRQSPGPLALQDYVAAIAQVVRDAGAPVVLVGHSMAGMIVSQVAEDLGPLVAAVIYVAGYLPRTGDTLQALAATDGDSLVGQSMQFASDYATVTIDPARVGEAIAGDLPLDVQTWIRDQQRPEPLAPFQGAVTLTEARFGRTRKGYLHTTRDRAVTLAFQQRMVAAYPGIVTATIDTAHLPFVSRPQEFATLLEHLIAECTTQNK